MLKAIKYLKYLPVLVQSLRLLGEAVADIGEGKEPVGRDAHTRLRAELKKLPDLGEKAS